MELVFCHVIQFSLSNKTLLSELLTWVTYSALIWSTDGAAVFFTRASFSITSPPIQQPVDIYEANLLTHLQTTSLSSYKKCPYKPNPELSKW